MKPLPAARVHAMAEEAGFDFAAVAPAGPSPRAAALEAWLAAGRHAGMGWMARDPAGRADPRRWMPEARAVVMAGVSYFVERPPPALRDDPARGRVACYAWGRNYHEVLRERLDQLAGRLRRELGGGVPIEPFVDTRPVLERAEGERAGLGFYGRNTQLIHPGYGSCFFLAGLLVGAELEADAPRAWAPGTGCGRCTRCGTACPGGALAESWTLDSRHCLSYLTIEHRGSIPLPMRPRMGRWVFGCDACQAVCPWVRRFARPARAPFLAFEPERDAPRLTELLAITPEAFRARYGATPVARARRRGLRRNAAVALGNSRDVAGAAAALRVAAADPDPVVAEHARWALGMRNAE